MCVCVCECVCASSSSSSPCRATPEPLSPLISIVHRSLQVFHAISGINTCYIPLIYRYMK